MKHRALTPDELAALRTYAERHGRYWKAALREAWMTASEPGVLQALRNDQGFGPSGLIAFRFEKQPVPPLAPSTVDISTISEYGLTQKLSNSIRCF